MVLRLLTVIVNTLHPIYVYVACCVGRYGSNYVVDTYVRRRRVFVSATWWRLLTAPDLLGTPVRITKCPSPNSQRLGLKTLNHLTLLLNSYTPYSNAQNKNLMPNRFSKSLHIFPATHS